MPKSALSKKSKKKPVPTPDRVVAFQAFSHARAIAKAVRSMLSTGKHLSLMEETVSMLGDLRAELEGLLEVLEAKERAKPGRRSWVGPYKKKDAGPARPAPAGVIPEV